MKRRMLLGFSRFRRGLYRSVNEHEDQRGVLIFFLGFALLVALVSLPLNLEGPETPLYLLFVVLLVASLVLALRDQLMPGKVLAPLVAFALLTDLVYRGGIHDDALGGYYLLLLAVCLLWGQNMLLLYGLMSTTAVALIGLAETSGWITTRFGPLTEPLTIVTTALFLLGTTLALHFLVARLRQSAHQARRNERAQSKTNMQLRELQRDLELRVEERTADLDYANQQLQLQLEHINSLQAKLRQEAIRDPLTGLFNRRYLTETLLIEEAQARRANLPITILLADIDHFKDVNDVYGHAAGDHVLQGVANTLKANTRAGDIVARYGGEEFIVVLPGMKEADARVRAEALRARVEAGTIEQDGRQVRVTISTGLAVYPANGDTCEAVIEAADAALYQAKHNGRNRVELATRPGMTEKDGKA